MRGERGTPMPYLIYHILPGLSRPPRRPGPSRASAGGARTVHPELYPLLTGSVPAKSLAASESHTIRLRLGRNSSAFFPVFLAKQLRLRKTRWPGS